MAEGLNQEENSKREDRPQKGRTFSTKENTKRQKVFSPKSTKRKMVFKEGRYGKAKRFETEIRLRACAEGGRASAHLFV